jgi:hypothetical protein
MINKVMNNKSKPVTGSVKNVERKPNENAGFHFSSSVKIFDPNTQQVILHKRGDD